MRREIGRRTHRVAVAAAVLLALACLPLSLAPGAGAEPIAYPDLQVLMPTGDIAIMHKSGQRLLEFTHITEDAGAGPFEIRPSYNPATGISQGFQALYSMPSPGVWKFAETVPIVGPMVWTPPSDYNFPLDRFRLYSATPEGGVGSLVATSPKDLFCMTSDTFVGGVPNTPAENGYPSGACTEPEGRLGLSVGWGDQYEFTDGGEGIDITGLANGTYWLRGEADPYHYLVESNVSNDVTDTKLSIEGEKVKVLEQMQPSTTPPSVSLTAPPAEATVSGSVSLSASASGPAPISSVQFLLDGQPIGAPVASPPYKMTWNVGSTTPGPHYLSAQATDSRGFQGTAPDTPVTVGARVGSVTIAKVISQGGDSSVSTAPFSAQPGQVLLAFVDADGPSTGGQTVALSGSALEWHLVRRADSQPGDAEVWTATAAAPVSGETATATAGDGGYHVSLTVAVLSGASGVGAWAASSSPKGPPSISVTSSGGGSVAFATGNDWDRAVARTLGPGQELLHQELQTGTGDTFWSQYSTAASSGPGQTMTVDDSAPSADRWNMAAVEVLPAVEGPDSEPPSVAITAPVGGQTVSGTAQVSASASDNVAVASVQFYLDGSPLGAPVTARPYAVSWNTREVANGTHTLSAVATDTSGNKGESAPVEVTVENPIQPGPCFVVDVTTSAEGAKKVSTAPFTTAEPGEQLFAFVSADGPAGAGHQSAKVSGGGVKWTLVRRADEQTGDAEIWTATAKKALHSKKVKSVLAVKGYDQLRTVISVEMSDGAGASAAASAPGGPPSVSLMTDEAESLVYAVGSDPAGAVPRVPGSNQVILHEEVNATIGKTFWTQLLGTITGPAGELVTLDDTAPGGDPWNMAAVEIRGDGPGA
jgi:hypothetical protein